jgi:CheY-like chemotaxis protein
VLQESLVMTELTEVPNSRPTVLIVDDSPDMLRYLRLLLESDSYLVETASTGREALRRVRQGCVPDVVLLDMQMPGLDGLKTLRRLRKLRPDLRVIMCSGVDDPRQMRRASLMGAHSYLTKPVRHLYLSAALERCLRKDANSRENSSANVVPISFPHWH